MNTFLKSVSKGFFIGLALVVFFIGHQVFAADTTPPTYPQTVVVTNITDNSALVSWAAATDPGTDASGVKGYNIYLGVIPGAAINSSVITTTSYTLSNLTKGTPYMVWVDAVDNGGLKSTKAFAPLLTTGGTSTNTQDGGYKFNVKINNPLAASGVDDIPGLFNKILDALMLFLVPVVVVLIIYAGFLFVTAQGNDKKITDAKLTLLWTLVGAAILLGAKVIAGILSSTVTNILK